MAREVRDLRLRDSWPFVEVYEREESAAEHATVAGLCLLAVGGFLTVQPTGYAVGAALAAFTAGLAVRAWHTSQRGYGSGGGVE